MITASDEAEVALAAGEAFALLEDAASIDILAYVRGGDRWG